MLESRRSRRRGLHWVGHRPMLTVGCRVGELLNLRSDDGPRATAGQELLYQECFSFGLGNCLWEDPVKMQILVFSSHLIYNLFKKHKC